MNDESLARQIAQAAGELLLDLQRSRLFDGKNLGKVGDLVAHVFIMQALATHRPNDAVLSEEQKDNPGRLTAERVWIVDPLDGTREYGERRTDWAVHIALAINGVAEVGAVALPGIPLTLSSADVKLAEPRAGTLRMLVSRTRPAAEAVSVAQQLGAELLPMGSAGAKAMAVVRGEAEIYLHSGGQYEWDSCAPVAIARAAGLHVSRIDGSPMLYNRPDVYMPDLLITRPELAPAVFGALRSSK
jgi:3'(2'), 5'-bisphosphate nucleotidase